MDIYEELVMVYLTRDPLVFICPQYDIGKGWSAPDFVALDFREKSVLIVEVTAAAKLKRLAEKVADRKNQWIDKLLTQLSTKAHPVIDKSWTVKVKVFLRKDAEAAFRRVVGEADDVEIVTLEGLGFPWGWDWGLEAV